MAKRIASSIIWFLAVGWGFNYISSITGVSPLIGMVLGVSIGAFVGMDPLHVFWPVTTKAPTAQMRDAVPATGALQTQA